MISVLVLFHFSFVCHLLNSSVNFHTGVFITFFVKWINLIITIKHSILCVFLSYIIVYTNLPHSILQPQVTSTYSYNPMMFDMAYDLSDIIFFITMIIVKYEFVLWMPSTAWYIYQVIVLWFQHILSCAKTNCLDLRKCFVFILNDTYTQRARSDQNDST